METVNEHFPAILICSTLQPLKRMILATCGMMDEFRGHYVKWKKPDTERSILYVLTHVWSPKESIDLTEAEKWHVVPSGCKEYAKGCVMQGWVCKK